MKKFQYIDWLIEYEYKSLDLFCQDKMFYFANLPESKATDLNF